MFCLSQWRLGVLCSGIVLAHLQARPMLAQLQSQTSAKPVEQSAAKASPAPSTNRGAVSAPSPASREVPDSTQYLLPGCEVVSTGKSSSNRDFSTPSSRRRSANASNKAPVRPASGMNSTPWPRLRWRAMLSIPTWCAISSHPCSAAVPNTARSKKSCRCRCGSIRTSNAGTIYRC